MQSAAVCASAELNPIHLPMEELSQVCTQLGNLEGAAPMIDFPQKFPAFFFLKIV